MPRIREHQYKHLVESCNKVMEQFAGYPVNLNTIIHIENKLMEIMDPVIGYPEFKFRIHGANIYMDLDMGEEIIDI